MQSIKEVISQLRLQGAKMLLPLDQRFFVPNESIWEILSKYKDKNIVDCGTGMGDLPIEAKAKGFSIVGIDIREISQVSHILMGGVDAAMFPFSKEMVALICRPSHGEWISNTIENVLTVGATVIYVGLIGNFDRDVSEELQGKVIEYHPEVGEEDESMWIFRNGS